MFVDSEVVILQIVKYIAFDNIVCYLLDQSEFFVRHFNDDIVCYLLDQSEFFVRHFNDDIVYCLLDQSEFFVRH